MKKYVLTPLFCLALLMGAAGAHAESMSLPRFTWAAFQRFWNARSLPGAALAEGRIVEHGRLINFSNTLRAFVWIEDETVRGFRARYFDPTGQHEFALLFVRVIQSAVAAGTFRWPLEKIIEARQLFYEMKEEALEYRYMVTVFRRSYNPAVGWEFSFVYALPEDDLSRFVWPDENER